MSLQETLSENSLAVAGIALVVIVLVGTGAFFALSGGSDTGQTAIPQGSDTLVYVDPGVVTADSTSTMANTLMSEFGMQDNVTYQEMLEQEAGDDLQTVKNIDSITVFANSENESMSGMILRSSVSTEEFLNTIQNNSVEGASATLDSKRTYNGKTVYVFTSTQRVEELHVAELSEGVYVAGTPASVEASVDTYVGDSEPVSQDVLNDLDRSSGTYLSFVSTLRGLEQASEQGVERLSGSYSSDGENIMVDVTADMTDSENASRVKSTAETFMNRFKQQYQSDEVISNNLERISFSQNGDSVSVSYEAPAEDVGKLLARLVRLSGLSGL